MPHRPPFPQWVGTGLLQRIVHQRWVAAARNFGGLVAEPVTVDAQVIVRNVPAGAAAALAERITLAVSAIVRDALSTSEAK